jgi:Fe-S-cluster containining protein
MPAGSNLVHIVDAAMAEAVRKSGAWLACKPGCTPCCMGPFPIAEADAARLREGLRELERQDRDRAAKVRERAAQWLERDDVEDEACPALDPASGLCDLYEARPITCRVFGPAVRSGGDAVGACELCYVGASDEEIAACAVEIKPWAEDEEETTVALALTR